MGADDRRLFSHVILPGALPYILTGLRLGLAQGLAHPGRGGDARRGALGARLADLRRARIPQYRRYDGRHLGDRHRRSGAGEIRVREDRALHRRALGMVSSMTENGKTIRSIVRAAISLAAAAAVYEAAARSGYFAPALLPTIPIITKTLFAMLADGSMIEHSAFTLYRVMFGFFLAVAVGLPLGILMARFQRVENFFLPLVSGADADPLLRAGAAVHAVVRHRQSDHDHDRVLRHLPGAVQHLVGGALGQSDLAARGRRHGRRREYAVLEGDHSRRLALHHHRPAAGVLALLDRGGGRRDDRGLRLGARLGDLRRQGIPQHRHHAGLARRHRRHRLPCSNAWCSVRSSARRCCAGA